MCSLPGCRSPRFSGRGALYCTNEHRKVLSSLLTRHCRDSYVWIVGSSEKRPFKCLHCLWRVPTDRRFTVLWGSLLKLRCPEASDCSRAKSHHPKTSVLTQRYLFNGWFISCTLAALGRGGAVRSNAPPNRATIPRPPKVDTKPRSAFMMEFGEYNGQPNYLLRSKKGIDW